MNDEHPRDDIDCIVTDWSRIAFPTVALPVMAGAHAAAATSPLPERR